MIKVPPPSPEMPHKPNTHPPPPLGTDSRLTFSIKLYGVHHYCRDGRYTLSYLISLYRWTQTDGLGKVRAGFDLAGASGKGCFLRLGLAYTLLIEMIVCIDGV